MKLGKAYIDIDEGSPAPSSPDSLAALQDNIAVLVRLCATVRSEGLETRRIVDSLRAERDTQGNAEESLVRLRDEIVAAIASLRAESSDGAGNLRTEIEQLRKDFEMKLGKVYIDVDEGSAGASQQTILEFQNQIDAVVRLCATIRSEGVAGAAAVRALQSDVDSIIVELRGAITGLRMDSVALSESVTALAEKVGGLQGEVDELRAAAGTPWWRRLLNWIGLGQ